MTPLRRSLLAGLLLAAAASFSATARAEVSAKACAGLLPLAITPPAGASGFDSGCAGITTLMPWTPGGDAVYNGLQFPSCDAGECASQSPQGNDAVRCLMAHGNACCVHAGDPVHAAPSGQLGAFRSALGDRWSGDSDQRDDICFASYTGNGQRLLLLPVTTSVPGPAGDVVVTDIVTAFLASRPGMSARSDLNLEILPTLAVPVRTPTWGQIRTLYR
jgi:hypothetical protein